MVISSETGACSMRDRPASGLPLVAMKAWLSEVRTATEAVAPSR